MGRSGLPGPALATRRDADIGQAPQRTPAGRSAPPEAALSGPLGQRREGLGVAHTTAASAPCERAGERGEMGVYLRRLV